MKRKNHRGTILAENLIFIILNIIFLAILIIFLFTKTGDVAILEEKYAKQIALVIDSAKPSMVIHLNMEDAIKGAEKKGIKPNEIVFIQSNIVTVNLRGEGGYSYSFFNDVKVTSYPDTNNKEYIFFISKK